MPGPDTRKKMDNAFLVDLDGDGDMDIATTEENGGWGVIWFENPANHQLAGPTPPSTALSSLRGQIAARAWLATSFGLPHLPEGGDGRYFTHIPLFSPHIRLSAFAGLTDRNLRAKSRRRADVPFPAAT